MSTLLERLKQKELELKSGDYSKFKKIPAGRSRWRILPHWADASQLPLMEFGKHFVKDATGTVKGTYVCLNQVPGDRSCPVCLAIAQASNLNSSGDEVITTMLKEASASPRAIVNAVSVDPETREHGKEVVLLDLPKTVVTTLISLAIEYAQSEGIDIFDYATGYDIIVNRDGSGLNTKYSVAVAPKSTPADPALATKLTNLDNFVEAEIARDHSAAVTTVRALVGGFPTGLTSLPSSVSSPKTVSAPSAEVTAEDLEKALEGEVEDLDLEDIDLSDLDETD